MGNHLFTIYHPHYKDKIVINPTRIFICTTSYLYFRYSLASLGNLLAAFFFTYNNNTYTTKLGRVTNKKESPRISLYLPSHLFQPLPLFFRFTISDIHMAIFKYTLISVYLAMSKYTIMTKWQFTLILASFLFLADYLSMVLTDEEKIKVENIMRKNCGYLIFTQNLLEVSSDCSYMAQIATQIVEFLLDDNILLNKQL